MSDRKEKRRESYYVALGVMLGVFAQAVYDMVRYDIAYYEPTMAMPKIDLAAAFFSIIFIWVIWKKLLNE